MPKLLVIIASTRPGRIGLPIGLWTAEAARQHGGFEVELVDLADLDLPLLDEPNHPRQKSYLQPHTLTWSATVESADAFLFVTPEYNYGPPPSLLNAISYLYWEWTYKPVAFVSYGGLAAGLRSVQVLKQIVTTLRMMPISDGVAVTFPGQYVTDGVFTPTPIMAATLPHNLDEVLRWSTALQPLRDEIDIRRTERPPGTPPPTAGGPPRPAS